MEKYNIQPSRRKKTSCERKSKIVANFTCHDIMYEIREIEKNGDSMFASVLCQLGIGNRHIPAIRKEIVKKSLNNLRKSSPDNIISFCHYLSITWCPLADNSGSEIEQYIARLAKLFDQLYDIENGRKLLIEKYSLGKGLLTKKPVKMYRGVVDVCDNLIKVYEIVMSTNINDPSTTQTVMADKSMHYGGTYVMNGLAERQKIFLILINKSCEPQVFGNPKSRKTIVIYESAEGYDVAIPIKRNEPASVELAGVESVLDPEFDRGIVLRGPLVSELNTVRKKRRNKDPTYTFDYVVNRDL